MKGQKFLTLVALVLIGISIVGTKTAKSPEKDNIPKEPPLQLMQTQAVSLGLLVMLKNTEQIGSLTMYVIFLVKMTLQ